jgi:hypothetical protein
VNKATPRYEQASDEELDYGFLFSDNELLDSDTIATSVWSAPVGIVLSNSVVNSTPIIRYGRTYRANTCTAVFVSGGVHNGKYLIKNRITTALGRKITRSLMLFVVD